MRDRTRRPTFGLAVMTLVAAGLLAATTAGVASAGSGTAQGATAQLSYQPGPVEPFVALDQVRSQWDKVEASLQPPRVDVKGIYLTSYSAGHADTLDPLIGLVDRTDLNAMVINVKDDWGNVTLDADIPLAKEAGAIHADLGDGKDLIAKLHAKKIYAIARIVTFKDAFIPKYQSNLAVASTAGGIWHDYNGVTWLNQYNKASWDYVISIGKAAALAGFDEVQFDYVRFPTDGPMSQLSYPGKDNRPQQQVIADFLAYARKELHPYGVWVSADVFGLVTSLYDDLGIGQHLEEASAGVDYLSPMVYPSHYIPGNLGLPNPNAMPYETVHRSMLDAKERWAKAGLTGKVEMRPWLQDFSMGYPYGVAEVKAQIQATYDAGYKQFLLWNAANEYTEAALAPAGKP